MFGIFRCETRGDPGKTFSALARYKQFPTLVVVALAINGFYGRQALNQQKLSQKVLTHPPHSTPHPPAPKQVHVLQKSLGWVFSLFPRVISSASVWGNREYRGIQAAQKCITEKEFNLSNLYYYINSMFLFHHTCLF